MKFHPYSEVFPLLSDQQLGELVDDIKAFGLRESIVLYRSQILDGRNRFLACQKADVRPRYTTFKGTDRDARALVISSNIHRRHLTVEQRAFAAARLAQMQPGDNQYTRDEVASLEATSSGSEVASREATSQAEAAEQLDVSRTSVQRASKVLKKGSRRLQKATEAGEVSLQRAAKVADLPKNEQMAAAKKKPEPAVSSVTNDDWEPEPNEEAYLEQLQKDLTESVEKVMRANDKLSAAYDEIKRQAAEIANLKLSRDGFMNGKTELNRLLRKEQQKVARLERELAHLKRRAA